MASDFPVEERFDDVEDEDVRSRSSSIEGGRVLGTGTSAIHRKLEEDLRERNETVQNSIQQKRSLQYKEIASSRRFRGTEAFDAIQDHFKTANEEFEENQKQKRDEHFREFAKLRRASHGNVLEAAKDSNSPNADRKRRQSHIESEIRRLKSSSGGPSVRDIASRFKGQSKAEPEEIYRKRIVEQEQTVLLQRKKAREILSRLYGGTYAADDLVNTPVEGLGSLDVAEKKNFLEAWANMKSPAGATSPRDKTRADARQFLNDLGVAEDNAAWCLWEKAIDDMDQFELHPTTEQTATSTVTLAEPRIGVDDQRESLELRGPSLAGDGDGMEDILLHPPSVAKVDEAIPAVDETNEPQLRPPSMGEEMTSEWVAYVDTAANQPTLIHPAPVHEHFDETKATDSDIAPKPDTAAAEFGLDADVQGHSAFRMFLCCN